MKSYWITVSMQKISSIHKLIQQILGSHELNDLVHFWPGPPINYWNKFLLSWICTTMQNRFIIEIQPILESRDQTGYIHFWRRPSKFFLINCWFVWICINMQKVRLFHWFILEIWLIKKCCNLIGWEYFSSHLGNQNFSI